MQMSKACLLANAGLTRGQAGQKWYSLTSDCMKGKSTGEVLQYMNRLLDQIYDSAVNEQDHHARIVLSRIRSIVDDDFHLHLENCVVQTRQNLKKTAIEAWESSHRGFGRGKHYKMKRHSPLVCHMPQAWT